MLSVYSNSVYPSDQALKTGLDEAYGGGTQDWMKDLTRGFFAEPYNMRYVRAVMDFYSRTLPGQDNHNHWDDQFTFFRACQYFKQFNLPVDNTDQTNCLLFKSLQTAIEQAMEEANKLNVSGAESGVVFQYKMKILADIKDYVNAAYSTLVCDFYLSQTQQQQQLDVLTQATQQAAAPATTGYSTYIIYAVIALIVVVVLVKIFKHKSA